MQIGLRADKDPGDNPSTQRERGSRSWRGRGEGRGRDREGEEREREGEGEGGTEREGGCNAAEGAQRVSSS